MLTVSTCRSTSKYVPTRRWPNWCACYNVSVISNNKARVRRIAYENILHSRSDSRALWGRFFIEESRQPVRQYLSSYKAQAQLDPVALAPNRWLMENDILRTRSVVSSRSPTSTVIRTSYCSGLTKNSTRVRSATSCPGETSPRYAIPVSRARDIERAYFTRAASPFD